MPSLRVCFAALLLIAVSILAPVIASVDSDLNLLSIRSPLSMSADDAVLFERSLVAPVGDDLSFEKRDVENESIARIRLAKTRAARKAKRQTISLDALASFRITFCLRDSQCKAFGTPAHGSSSCSQSTHLCVIACNSGYTLQPNGTCLTDKVTCPKLSHGIYYVQGGKCVPYCNSAGGFSLSGTSTANYTCVKRGRDVNNCGSKGNVCPASYNGVGTAVCRKGSCGLKCTGGTFAHTTPSGASYCA